MRWEKQPGWSGVEIARPVRAVCCGGILFPGANGDKPARGGRGALALALAGAVGFVEQRGAIRGAEGERLRRSGGIPNPVLSCRSPAVGRGFSSQVRRPGLRGDRRRRCPAGGERGGEASSQGPCGRRDAVPSALRSPAGLRLCNIGGDAGLLVLPQCDPSGF